MNLEELKEQIKNYAEQREQAVQMQLKLSGAIEALVLLSKKMEEELKEEAEEVKED
jgi:hypothetical protein